MKRRFGWLLPCSIAAVTTLTAAAPAAGQDLADFDYENLSFRGISLNFGHQWANRVEERNTFGIAVDLGYLGPGLRIRPSLTYWSSRFKQVEVDELEASVESFLSSQEPSSSVDVDLGTVEWSDIVFAVDAQVVWRLDAIGLLTYLGLGGSIHFLNGDGEAITGTFVEDLLDSASPGIGLHAGFEIPWESFRPYVEGRYELLEDLNYFEVRLGLQIMTGSSLPSELGG